MMKRRGDRADPSGAGSPPETIRTRLISGSRWLMPAAFWLLVLLAVSGCSTGDPSEAGAVRSVEQNVVVPPSGYFHSGGGATQNADGLVLPTGAFAVFSVPLPEDGHYTVLYRVSSVASAATLEMREYDGSTSIDPDPDNDPLLGQTAILPRELDADPTRPTTNVSHNVQLVRENGGTERVYLYNPGAVTVVVTAMTIAPLRSTGVADQSTTSFLSGTNSCRGCHTQQWTQWRSSMMGYSSISPPIHNLELTQNHVGPDPTVPGIGENAGPHGRFGRRADAPLDEAYSQDGPSLFCQRCHAPSATFTDVLRVFKFHENPDGSGASVFETAARGDRPDSHVLLRILLAELERIEVGTDPRDPKVEALLRDDPSGSGKYLDTLNDTEKSLLKSNTFAGTEGVTCKVCHSVNGTFEDTNMPTSQVGPDEVGISNAAFRVVHNTGADMEARWGPYLDTELEAQHNAGQSAGSDTTVTGTDGVSRPFLRSSRFCGACHDVRIAMPDFGEDGVEGNTDDDGVEFDVRRVENLFTEWRNSPWNNDDNPYNPATGSNFSKSVMANPAGLATMEENPDGSPKGAPIDEMGFQKSTTTCQDCHMSMFGTHDDALPGQYEVGSITGPFGTPGTRRRSNHRFMGVDRFLTHELPTQDGEVPDDGLANFDVALGTDGLTATPPGTPADGYYLGSADDIGPTFGSRDLREILLQKAAEFKIEHVGAVEDTPDGPILPVTISVENVGAGHNLPAGLSQERQLWIQLEVVDANGDHVFTSGYLNSLSKGPFDKDGSSNYEDSYCGLNFGLNEWECELDGFRTTLGDFLNVTGPLLEPDDPGGDVLDTQLRNYQNGFKFGGEKVFTQFIGDHINNNNALKPFVKELEHYRVPVDAHPGPYDVFAKLRFRPLPFEFLETLHDAFPDGTDYPSRIDEEAMKKNKVIEMESDRCNTDGETFRNCNQYNATPVALGYQHSCFAISDDEVAGPSLQCFGDNGRGQVGIGVGPASIELPRPLSPIDVNNISLGREHTCAAHEDGTVSCWGAGDFGQLADNNTGGHQITGPAQVNSNFLSNVTKLASADYSSCAIVDSDDDDQAIKCWGSNFNGQLGVPGLGIEQGVPVQLNNVPNDNPGLPQGLGLADPEDIAGGRGHYCAIVGDEEGIRGRVRCWGRAYGNGSFSTGSTVRELSLPYRATDIGAGEDFSCALLQTGEVYCWGVNYSGQLGRTGPIPSPTSPVTVDDLTPQKVPLFTGGFEYKAKAIAVGRAHACAILDQGVASTVMCWGEGDNGRLGWSATDTSDQSTAQIVKVEHTSSQAVLMGAVAIDAGGRHTCAYSDFGGLYNSPGRYCWGDNSQGQVGLGGFDDAVPTTDEVEPSIGAGRTYWAPASKGGPGKPGCGPFNNCTDQVQWVDVNSGDYFEYEVDVPETGMYEIFFRVSMLTSPRTMNLSVNGTSLGSVMGADAPRPTSPLEIGGKELLPITVMLDRGFNTIRLTDSGGSEEFDMIYVRIRPASGESCTDTDTNQDETDENCGGLICEPCGEGMTCNGDIDCEGSATCEDNICTAPPTPPCNLGVATDLGGHGATTVVKSNACLKITNYPSWWVPRPVKILRHNGTTDMTFTWDNRGGGTCDPQSFGSGAYSSALNEVVIGDGEIENVEPPIPIVEGPVSGACPTLIQLNGDATTDITINWYGN